MVFDHVWRSMLWPRGTWSTTGNRLAIRTRFPPPRESHPNLYMNDHTLTIHNENTFIKAKQMADITIIEETLAHLASYGARAIIHTQDGIPIRSALNQDDTDTDSSGNFVPKLANLSARLFHTACDAARTAARATHHAGKRPNHQEARQIRPQTVDSIRIRTTKPNGTTAEIIIMNGESGNAQQNGKSATRAAKSGKSSDEPPLLVTVIQDCS